MKRIVNILSPIAARVRIAFLASKPELGRQHHAITATAVFQKFADQGFAGAVGVAVGGVDKVGAGIEKGVENLAR